MRATRDAPAGTRIGAVSATAASWPGTQLASSFGAAAPSLEEQRRAAHDRRRARLADPPPARLAGRAPPAAARPRGSPRSTRASSVNGAGIAQLQVGRAGRPAGVQRYRRRRVLGLAARARRRWPTPAPGRARARVSFRGCHAGIVSFEQLDAQRLGPRRRVVVGHQRHRRHAAFDVAAAAVRLEHREDVLVVEVLRGDRLVRLDRRGRPGDRGSHRPTAAAASGSDGNAHGRAHGRPWNSDSMCRHGRQQRVRGAGHFLAFAAVAGGVEAERGHHDVARRRRPSAGAAARGNSRACISSASASSLACSAGTHTSVRLPRPTISFTLSRRSRSIASTPPESSGMSIASRVAPSMVVGAAATECSVKVKSKR